MSLCRLTCVDPRKHVLDGGCTTFQIQLMICVVAIMCSLVTITVAAFSCLRCTVKVKQMHYHRIPAECFFFLFFFVTFQIRLLNSQYLAQITEQLIDSNCSVWVSGLLERQINYRFIFVLFTRYCTPELY